MSSYKSLQTKLDSVLEELESAETSDIDKVIALHAEAVGLIAKLETELEKAAKSVKKTK